METLDLGQVTDEEVEAITYAHGSRDVPDRDIVSDLQAIDKMMQDKVTGIDVIKALHKSGFEEEAEMVLSMLKQRLSGDYLQTSAILNESYDVMSTVNYPNSYKVRYRYVMSDERWKKSKNPHIIKIDDL